MKNYDMLIVRDAGNGVLVVELDRPPANALSDSMFVEIEDLFRDVGEADHVDVVVLTGAGGRVFCAGNDLDEFMDLSPDNGAARMRQVLRSLHAVYAAQVPVIAAVNGAAIGSGLALVASADFALSVPDAKFALPELDVGVLGGAKFGARMLPEQAMRRMLLTAAYVSATQLVEWGAPIELVPADELMDRAIDVAKIVASKGGRPLRLAKAALNGCEPMQLWDGYSFEQTFTVRMSGLPEAKEATAKVIDRIAKRERSQPSSAT